MRGNIRVQRHTLAPRFMRYQLQRRGGPAPLASEDEACKRLLPARIPPEHAEKAHCTHNASCKRMCPFTASGHERLRNLSFVI